MEIIHSEKECSAKLGAIGDALYVIGGKWKLRIIVALQTGNMRFNELQRTVKGISARVLSHELKELEMNGFIKRNIYTDPAIVVEYEVTSYCDSLGDVLRSLSEWGAMHRSKLKSERHTVLTEV